MPYIVVLVCAISAGIHAALAQDHFREGFALGAGFVAAAAALAVVAFVLSRRPASMLGAGSAALLLAGLLASYAMAVTTGVPGLHPEVEQVDGLALVTKAIEAAGLFAALSLLGQHRPFPVQQPRGALR